MGGVAVEESFDILGFGAVAVDELLYVDKYPPAEAKVRVRRRLRQCGGLTGTALVAAARLGARTAYVGRIGNDPLSAEVLQQFQAENVNVAHSVRRADACAAHSTIIVDQRNKTRTIFSSAEGQLGADPQLPDEALIAAAPVLLIDHHGVAGSLRALRMAQAHGGQVVADFERVSEPGFEELAAEVDHLIVSERFAKGTTGAHDPAQAAVELATPRRRAVVVTCGDAGCWYLAPAEGGSPRRFPAYPVEVADTTGCGDVFHGAYAAALVEGQDLASRIAFASAAAALKAAHPGGQSGLPTRQEVLRRLVNASQSAER
jgi:sugar/nucleoside kinase (ribokinase family)